MRRLEDMAAAGGWSDTATLLRSYQQSDEATLTQVVLEAPNLRANGAGGREIGGSFGAAPRHVGRPPVLGQEGDS